MNGEGGARPAPSDRLARFCGIGFREVEQLCSATNGENGHGGFPDTVDDAVRAINDLPVFVRSDFRNDAARARKVFEPIGGLE